MIAIKFSRQRAAYILDCLKNGKPISPQESSGWTGNDALALAGACVFLAISQGPESFWLKEMDKSKMLQEHAEHVDAVFDDDLHAAVGFYAVMFQKVEDSEFDDQHNSDDVFAMVSQQGDIERTMTPLKGFKDYPDKV